MSNVEEVNSVKAEQLYKVRVEMQIEGEFTDVWYEFYRTEEAMNQAREEFEKQHKRPDGSWIPNIDFVDFEVELVSLEEAKEDMTVAQFEELYGVNVEDLL